MSHWEDWGAPFGRVHISTADGALPAPSRREKKEISRLKRQLSRRVNLGPVLVGEHKLRRALAQGRKYAKGK